MTHTKFEPLLVNIKLLNNYIGTELPKYATEGSSGIDLKAAINKDIILKPGARCLVATGIQIDLPQGYEAQIRPRSGLAYKFGVTVLNTPGTIDSDYRGEIKAILINLGAEDFTINPEMRICQMVITNVNQVKLLQANKVSITKRLNDGFGSTGF